MIRPHPAPEPIATTAATAATSGTEAATVYRPGLDGLRAIAVTAVVLFHLGRLPGGNLGVDAFFVISGWLITWRLLAAAERTGRIDLGHFWGARFRRLLPASLAVIAAVVVIWPLAGIDVTSLRRDALFALGWSSNWGTISGGGDYWAKFGEPSPLTHFWSLAIEEQFYLVWPLLLTGVLLVVRRHLHWRRGAVTALSIAASVASIAYMVGSFDVADRTAAYMNTFARAHTLLIGAAAGAFTIALAGGTRLRGGRIARRLAPFGAVAAAAIVATSSERSDWLFRWGFPAFAVSMTVVVVAAADGLWQRWLASAPLRWIGDRSYALYLWHWPVIVLLDARRMHFGGLALDLVRVAVSVLLADLSFRWIEQPIRRRRRLTGWRAPLAAAIALAALITTVVVAVPMHPTPASASVVTIIESDPTESMPAPTTTTLRSSPAEPAVASGAVVAPATTLPIGGAATTTSAPPPPPPLRVLVAGDSTAVHLAEALLPYSRQHSDKIRAGSAAFPGCGLSAAPDGRMHDFTTRTGKHETIDLSGCIQEWSSIPRRVASNERYDIVLVSIGPWDGTDIHLTDGTTVSVADPTGRQMVSRSYQAFVAQVEAAGAQIVWITPPDISLQWGRVRSPMNDPARWAALRSIVDELPVEQIDLSGWLADNGFDGEAGRPDGVHLDPAVEIRYVNEVVVPTLLARRRN